MYADTDRIKHFKAEGAAPDNEDAYVEVRYLRTPDEDGTPTVDEIVSTQVHLEMMNHDSCWMSINGLHVWFKAKQDEGSGELRLVVTCFPSTCEPVVVTPETSETGM